MAGKRSKKKADDTVAAPKAEKAQPKEDAIEEAEVVE